MEEFITEQQFSQLVQFLEKRFNESPDDVSNCAVECALITCIPTCGICFCGCLYLMFREHQLKFFRFRLIAAFGDQTRDLGMSNVRLHFAESILPGAGCWIDSRNQPLDFGPPVGYSIVFTVQKEMQWPPVVINQQWQAISSAPPPYALKERGELSLSAELEQDEFCTNCGRKFTAEHKFCGTCGSPRP